MLLVVKSPDAGVRCFSYYEFRGIYWVGMIASENDLALTLASLLGSKGNTFWCETLDDGG